MTGIWLCLNLQRRVYLFCTLSIFSPVKLSKLIFLLCFPEKLRTILVFRLWQFYVNKFLLHNCLLVVLDAGSGVFWCLGQTRRGRFLTGSSHSHNKEPPKILSQCFAICGNCKVMLAVATAMQIVCGDCISCWIMYLLTLSFNFPAIKKT